MQAGSILAFLRLDSSQFKKDMKGVSSFTRRQMNNMAATTQQQTGRMTRSFGEFADKTLRYGADVEKGWWKTFGRVAVGFTIAYRAMNLFEEGLKRLTQTFIEGMTAIDEYRIAAITAASSLQMLTEVPSTQSFEDYLAFGKKVFRNLEVIARAHLSNAQQLRDAWTKLVALKIVPVTEPELEMVARLVDRILMLTPTMDAQRQIMTEIKAYVEGQLRAQAALAREASQILPTYKDTVEQIQKASTISEKTALFFSMQAGHLDAVGDASREIMETQMAWKATLESILNMMQRAGLAMMYEDILGYMKGISNEMLDENGLTERGIALAYGFHATWEIVKTVLTDVVDLGRDLVVIWSALTFNMKPITNMVKIMSIGMATIKALIDVISVGYKNILKPSEASYERLLDIYDELENTVMLIYDAGSEKNKKKFAEGLKAQEKLLKESIERALKLVADLRVKEGKDDAAKREKLEKEWAGIEKKYREQSTAFAEEELNRQYEQYKKVAKDKLVLEAWYADKLEKIRKKETDKFIKVAKELAAIEYAAPFDWEELIPESVEVHTMEAYVALAKELAAIEYAPPFDWEEWIPTGVLTEAEKEIQRSYEQMLDNIQNETADVFYDIFSGTIEGWDDLLDQMKDYFFRMLAEMAAQAIAEPIIVPIVQSITGGMFGGAAGKVSDIPGLSVITDMFETSPTSWLGKQGITWGKLAGSAFLGAVGYGTIGEMLGLPQSKYSGYGAGAGAAAGSIFGPWGTAIGALGGGLFGSLFGDRHKDWKEIFGFPETFGLGEDISLIASAQRGGGGDLVANINAALTELSQSMEAQFMAVAALLPGQMQADMIEQIEAIEFSLGGAGWVVRESHVEADIQAIMTSSTQRMQEAMMPLLRQAAESLLASVSEYYDFGEVDIASMGATELADFVSMAAQVALAWKEFTEPLEDIIAKHTLTDLEYQIRQLDIWYEEQKLMAEELGFGLELLNEAYELQIEAAREAAAAMTATAIEDFGTNLQDQINQLTMEPIEYQILQVEMEFQSMLAQIAAWAATTDSSLNHLIEQAIVLRDLQLAALLAQQEQAAYDAQDAARLARIREQQSAWQKQLADSLKAFEDAVKSWGKVFESITEQIFQMRTTITSPQTARERMAIVEAEIASITGGIPIEEFLDSLSSIGERTGVIERLQELWGQYLDLATEVYQRPSVEYQQVFQQTLDELTRMQDYMADYALEQWDIGEQQLTMLEEIENWLALMYAAIAAGGWSYQHGGIASFPQVARVGEIPEAIIPLQGGAVPVALTGGSGMQFTQNNYISGKDPERTGREVVKQTRSFLMNDAIFRTWTQRTAGGR